MRFAFPPLTPVVRAILIVLFASFVAQSLLQGMFALPVFEWLAMSPSPSIATSWQWATHVLVEYPSDRAVLARALELVFLYLWLSPFELEQGRNRTLMLAGLGAVGGALTTFAFGLLVPQVSIPHAGASAILWASIAALAVRTRGAPLNWAFFPSMNAWMLAGVFLVYEALQCAWMGTPTPLLASIGGFTAGVIYTRHILRPSPPKKKPGAPRRRGGSSHLSVIPGGQAEDERPRWLN